jgi:transcriptional regulator with XRE-family HTH domain
MTGDELKMCRKACDILQVELADGLGLRSSRISRWERGNETLPRWATIAAMQLLNDEMWVAQAKATRESLHKDGHRRAAETRRRRHEKGKTLTEVFAVEGLHATEPAKWPAEVEIPKLPPMIDVGPLPRNWTVRKESRWSRLWKWLI